MNTSVMQVRCAWCLADMGTKPCAPEQAGLTSHGICPPCAREMEARGGQPERICGVCEPAHTMDGREVRT